MRFAVLLDPILNASNYLTRVFSDKGVVELGALLWSINNVGIMFIAVFAYPLLRTLDDSLAVGYLACRIMEGTIMMVGIVATFLLIPLSQQYLEAGASSSSPLVAIGEVLKHARFLGLSQSTSPPEATGRHWPYPSPCSRSSFSPSGCCTEASRCRLKSHGDGDLGPNCRRHPRASASSRRFGLILDLRPT